jgi:hypothetical protein
MSNTETIIIPNAINEYVSRKNGSEHDCLYFGLRDGTLKNCPICKGSLKQCLKVQNHVEQCDECLYLERDSCPECICSETTIRYVKCEACEVRYKRRTNTPVHPLHTTDAFILHQFNRVLRRKRNQF